MARECERYLELDGKLRRPTDVDPPTFVGTSRADGESTEGSQWALEVRRSALQAGLVSPVAIALRIAIPTFGVACA